VATVQVNQRGGASQQPVTPADVYGDSHAVRMAFLQSAIREKVQLQQLANTGSGAQAIIMPTAGLLRKARLHVNGTYTTGASAAGGAVTKDGIYKIIGRSTFKDAGNQTRIDVASGWHLYAVMANNSKSGHDPSFATVASAQGGNIFAAPTPSATSTAYKFAFWLDYPFVWNKYDLRGLTNLNSAGRQATFMVYLVNQLYNDDTYPLSFGTAGATLTDITLTPNLWLYTMTAQQNKQGVSVPVPMNDLQIMQEITQNTIGTVPGSDNYYLIQPGRSVHKIYQRLILNGLQEPTTINTDTGVSSAGWDRIKFRYDNRNTPVDIRYADYLQDYRDETSRDFNGIFWDFTDRPWDSILTPQLQVGGKLTSDASTSGLCELDTVVHALVRMPTVNVLGLAA